MIEIYDRVFVDPWEVRGVYLRKLREEETTVVLLNAHEIRATPETTPRRSATSSRRPSRRSSKRVIEKE